MRRARLSRHCHIEPTFAGEPLSACANTRSGARAITHASRSFASPRSSINSSRIRVEPGVVSSKGRDGLDANDACDCGALWLTHPFYIHENVRGGRLLAELQELFHGDLRLVIAAYAAGERPGPRAGARTIRRQRFTPTFNGLDNSIAPN